MFVARATRAPRANYSCVLCGAFGYPADVEYLADALQLTSLLDRNRSRAAVSIAARLNRIDSLHRVDVLRAQRGRQIDTGAKNMWIACSVLAANRLATVKSLVFTGSQHGNLRRRFPG